MLLLNKNNEFFFEDQSYASFPWQKTFLYEKHPDKSETRSSFEIK